MKWKSNNGVLINVDIQFTPPIKPLDRTESVDMYGFRYLAVGVVYQMTIPEQLASCLLAWRYPNVVIPEHSVTTWLI